VTLNRPPRDGLSFVEIVRLSLFLLVIAVTPALRAGDYIADTACASCHPAKYASYQGVGMAQSMRRPRADVLIEDFRNARFFHKASQSWFEMVWKDGRLLFRRWQIDGGGRRINEIQQQVDWIVGSGHRSRVYLYRTPSGGLFQLPVAWYSQERAWGMAPGYDRADDDGITRSVRRECLFCHNAYPENTADSHFSPQRFPAAMPEGTGCQRCHGPGADHVALAENGEANAKVRAAIVNPARLPPALRDSVCFQCHLQPAVAMIGPRRFDRGDFSFRPGEALSDYMLHVDIDEPGRPREQRFEINHHAYRLRQSLCYIKGGISCSSCHDPHQPLKKDPRLANVVTICLGCHTRHTASNDCVRCHMPSRRAQDVVHVVMTDHKIQRRAPANLTAPLAEHESTIDRVEFLERGSAPEGTLGAVYKAVAVLRTTPLDSDAANFLSKHLDATPSIVPRLDLISAQLQQRQFVAALASIGALGSVSDPRVRAWRGSALMATGSTAEGIRDLRAATEGDSNVPEFQLNYGEALHRTGHDAEALPLLTRAIELRPNFVAAFLLRAEVLAALGRDAEAIADRRRAAAIDPRLSQKK
jgi:predicted CXXCH cytochrome family protein